MTRSTEESVLLPTNKKVTRATASKMPLIGICQLRGGGMREETMMGERREERERREDDEGKEKKEEQEEQEKEEERDEEKEK
jgi:hypothetical protein